MRKFIVLILSIGISECLAQDFIIKKNGDEIKAKVLEVNSTEVKFKNMNNPDGPLYSVAKSEIFMIKYENGMKEIISSADQSAPVPAPTYQQNYNTQYSYSVPIVPEGLQKIEVSGSNYYQNGLRLSNSKLYRLLKESPSTSARKNSVEAQTTDKTGKPLIILAIPLLSAGFTVGILASLVLSSLNTANTTTSSSTSSSGTTSSQDAINQVQTVQAVGFTMAGVGAGSLVAGITLRSSAKRKLIAAIDEHNQSIR